jgi:hypothetical protein
MMLAESRADDDRSRGGAIATARWRRLPGRDVALMAGQSLVFAGAIGCLFGIVALLARLL